MAHTLPASSRSYRGSHPEQVAAHQRPSGRSHSTRTDRSTITSPTPTRSRTQISPGIHGDQHPDHHNHSPPTLTQAPVQISSCRWTRRTAPPLSRDGAGRNDTSLHEAQSTRRTVTGSGPPAATAGRSPQSTPMSTPAPTQAVARDGHRARRKRGCLAAEASRSRSRRTTDHRPQRRCREAAFTRFASCAARSVAGQHR
jgi:hypothetical protein